MALINSFLLQKLGQPAWKPYDNQSRFLEALVDMIFNEYHETGTSRQRFRPGDTSMPFSQHNHIRRDKKSRCLGCQGVQIGPRSRSQSVTKRRALGQLDGNALNRQAPRQNRVRRRAGDVTYVMYRFVNVRNAGTSITGKITRK